MTGCPPGWPLYLIPSKPLILVQSLRPLKTGVRLYHLRSNFRHVGRGLRRCFKCDRNPTYNIHVQTSTCSLYERCRIHFWLWDVLITLDKEIEYVWQQQDRLIKILYLLVSLQVDIQWTLIFKPVTIRRIDTTLSSSALVWLVCDKVFPAEQRLMVSIKSPCLSQHYLPR
jgi:hypothetical protein